MVWCFSSQQSVMHQLLLYDIFNFWNQCQNSSENTHITCNMRQKHAWTIQNATKQRRVTDFRQRSTSLWSCVNDIRSSGMLSDCTHQSEVPLATDISVQLIHPSNINLSLLAQVTRNCDTTFRCKTRAIYQEPKKGIYPKKQPPPLSL